MARIEIFNIQISQIYTKFSNFIFSLINKMYTANKSINSWVISNFFCIFDYIWQAYMRTACNNYKSVKRLINKSGFQHIFFNMFALWMFGRTLEQVWGPKRFLSYYMVCGIGAGLVQELVQYIQYVTELSQYDSVNTGIAVIPMAEYLNLMTTVGASGAIYGILLAFGMLFPNSQMFVFPIPFPVKAKYFVMGYAALEIFLGLGASTDGVAHFAHLGGMIFGFILIMYWRKKNNNGQFYY